MAVKQKAGICFVCKHVRGRRSTVLLPGAAARSLFPDWDAAVPFPARVCAACLRAEAHLLEGLGAGERERGAPLAESGS